jgi:hypothetical protein
MKYWIAFINFMFCWIVDPIVKGLISIYLFFKALWMPIYIQEHPTMCKVVDWLNGKKTYIVSIAGIIGLIIGFHEKAINLGQIITTLPLLITAITIRHGIGRGIWTDPNTDNPEPMPLPPPSPPLPYPYPIPVPIPCDAGISSSSSSSCQ